MIEHDSIGLLLGRFGLSGMQSQLEEIEAAAQNGSWTYRQFLRELFEREEAMRSARRLKRLLKEAQLPEAKTAANLELKAFSQATRQAFTQLCEGGFCESAQNVLAFGLPGRGTTHFLAAVGHELILRHQKRMALWEKDPSHHSMPAQSMGPSHPLFRLPQRNPKDDFPHQRHRKFAHAIAQGA